MRRSATVVSRGNGRNKTWWARLNYIDEATGKRRDRQRRAESYAHAKELAEQLANEFDQSAGRSIDAERMTFAELADYCEKHYYKAAQYHDERKVAGVRGLGVQRISDDDRPGQAAELGGDPVQQRRERGNLVGLRRDLHLGQDHTGGGVVGRQ